MFARMMPYLNKKKFYLKVPLAFQMRKDGNGCNSLYIGKM